MIETVNGILVTPGSSFRAYDRPNEKGYAILRDGELVAYAPTKRAAKTLKGQLNSAAQQMRWAECTAALEAAHG